MGASHWRMGELLRLWHLTHISTGDQVRCRFCSTAFHFLWLTPWILKDATFFSAHILHISALKLCEGQKAAVPVEPQGAVLSYRANYYKFKWPYLFFPFLLQILMHVKISTSFEYPGGKICSFTGGKWVEEHFWSTNVHKATAFIIP